MNKTTSNNTKKTTFNNKKNLLILLVTAVTLVTIIFIYFSGPVQDGFDRKKFDKLDTQMQGLFNKLTTAASESDTWKYDAVCSANKTGWMPTGDYSCLTSISTQKYVTSVQEINDLQSKYYPIIDNSDTLIQKTELDPQLPNDFGLNFVVSSAEKHYIEKNSGILCQYLIELDQSYEMGHNFTYGSSINNGTGSATISLRCEENARDYWFKLVDDTSMLIP